MTEELGNYETSFFIMNVPTKADLEIRDMADEDFAIFFHEYIHFLQDITSFYGYMGIYSHGEYMRRAINDIYVGPRRFNVPLEFEERGDFVTINKRIASLSLGDKEELNFVIIKDVLIHGRENVYAGRSTAYRGLGRDRPLQEQRQRLCRA